MLSVSLISILHVSVQMHDCMIAYMAEVDTYNKGRNEDKVQEELFGMLTSVLLSGFE